MAAAGRFLMRGWAPIIGSGGHACDAIGPTTTARSVMQQRAGLAKNELSFLRQNISGSWNTESSPATRAWRSQTAFTHTTLCYATTAMLRYDIMLMLAMRMLAILDRLRNYPPRPLASRWWRSLTRMVAIIVLTAMRMLAIFDRWRSLTAMRMLAIIDRHRKDPPRPLASMCWRSLTAAFSF